MDFVYLIIGLVCLIVGGDFLVKGAVSIALKTKVSPLVIGMTIVSFGTSAPELLVSINAALEPGDGNLMSLGNVIGSNIANLSLVLGITAMVSSIGVDRDSVFQDWPVLMVSTAVFWLFMLDMEVVRWEGILLFVGIVFFTIFMIWKSRTKNKLDESVIEGIGEFTGASKDNKWKNIAFLIIGILGLTFGSDWLLEGATNIAASYGVSPYIIGVTILAFGTSIPELATSVIAAFKKESDIAIGNLIGSNIFNILSVVGITSIITPLRVGESVLNYDVYWMIGIALVIFPMMFFTRVIKRWMGVVLFSAYGCYIYFLIG